VCCDSVSIAAGAEARPTFVPVLEIENGALKYSEKRIEDEHKDDQGQTRPTGCQLQ
jgi:hypothetical protein